MIFLYIILTIILIALIAALGCFIYIFVRGKESDLYKDAYKSPWKAYAEEIVEGISYIRSLNWQIWEIMSEDGLRLEGRWLDNNSDKTFLLVHGYHSNGDNDFTTVVIKLNEEGYNILLVDQRSHRNSEGQLITFGIKERKDVVLWAKEIIRRKVDDQKLIIEGVSMGATSVLMACDLDLPEQVRVVVADCGFTSPYDIVANSIKAMNIPVRPVMVILECLSKLIGKFSLSEANTIEAMKNNTIPVFFAHGKADDFVPYDMSLRAYENCSSPKHLFSVEDAWHVECWLKDKERYWAELSEFMNRFM